MLVVIALLPLLVTVLLLLVLRWNVYDAGWATLGVTIALVSLAPIFHCAPRQIALSLGEAAATMVTASSILLPSLWLYQMQQETGAIELLGQGIAWLVPDRDLQTLLLVLGVGPCIESLCGFGSGAIAILPLLVRLHGDRLKAVQLSLLSQVAVPWGSLDMGTTLAANLAGIPVGILSIHTALLLLPSAIGFSLLALRISGGNRTLTHYWGVAPCAGGLLMLITCLCSQLLTVELAGVLSGGCVIVLVLVLVWGQRDHDGPHFSARDGLNISKALPFVSALLPYFLLIIGIGTTRLIPPIRSFLQTYGVLTAPAIKLHLALLYSPGIWLVLAALIHIPLFSLRRTHLARVQAKTARQFLPGAFAMVNFLATAALMQNSGITALLAKAATTLESHAIWIASFIGAVGGWLMNTLVGSSALTVPMQMEICAHLDIPLLWPIAAQNASAAMASAIAPSRVMVLAAAAGLFGKEALVLRKGALMVFWSLVLNTLLLVWFTTSLWLDSVIVLLALLLTVNAPLLSTGMEQCRDRWREKYALLRLFLFSPQRKSTQRHWFCAPGWMMQALAYGGLLLVNVLYASFSLVSVEPLSRIDPVLFVCFQMLLLAPLGLVFLLSARTQLQRVDIQRGIQLGGFLSAGLLCYTLSLRDTGITEAMMFSALNGGVATLIAWKLLGQRISTLTQWACLCALGGACLVWAVSPAKWQGECMALVGGLFLTGYAFHVERLLDETQHRHQAVLPTIGVQLLTMALITGIAALCFGQWETLHRFTPSDLERLVYVSLATILLPCLLMLKVQRMLSAVTVAFFSVVEPLVGGCMACFSFGERLPVLAYLGGGMVIASIVLQVAGEAIKQRPQLDASSLG